MSGKVVSELMIDDEGRVETVNGRVVEGVDRIGNFFPVSLYLTKLEVQDSTKVSLPTAQSSQCVAAMAEMRSPSSVPGLQCAAGQRSLSLFACCFQPRFMAVMEPVARETAQVALDEHGAILWCDSTLLKIYHLERSDILGMHLSKLIPSLSLSSARTVQHVVTKGSESIVIPATLMLGPVDAQTKEMLVGDGLPSTDAARVEELGTIHVYRNISGLITCDEEGLVCSWHDNFVLLLFGYTEHQLKGKPVQNILPDIPSGSLGSCKRTLHWDAQRVLPWLPQLCVADQCPNLCVGPCFLNPAGLPYVQSSMQTTRLAATRRSSSGPAIHKSTTL